jgi:cytochrome c556
LVYTWGADGTTFIGRAMTLYRDPSVKFGGLEVGGIRISHMSDIEKPVTMALTATRANRKPFTVQPLKGNAANQSRHAQQPPQTVRQDAGATPRTQAPASALLRQYHERLSKEAFREDVEAAHADLRHDLIAAGDETVQTARRILGIHTDRVEGRRTADEAAADVAALLGGRP